MKQINIPKPFEVTVTDTEGEPVKEDGEIVRVSFARFCRVVLMHDAFVENLDAIEATELRLTVKKKLDALTPETAKLLLEDDECNRLQKAVKAIRPGALFAMACIHFMHAIRDAKKHEEPKPEEDAATAN